MIDFKGYLANRWLQRLCTYDTNSGSKKVEHSPDQEKDRLIKNLQKAVLGCLGLTGTTVACMLVKNRLLCTQNKESTNTDKQKTSLLIPDENDTSGKRKNTIIKEKNEIEEIKETTLCIDPSDTV